MSKIDENYLDYKPRCLILSPLKMIQSSSKLEYYLSFIYFALYTTLPSFIEIDCQNSIFEFSNKLFPPFRPSLNRFTSKSNQFYSSMHPTISKNFIGIRWKVGSVKWRKKSHTYVRLYCGEFVLFGGCGWVVKQEVKFSTPSLQGHSSHSRATIIGEFFGKAFEIHYKVSQYYRVENHRKSSESCSKHECCHHAKFHIKCVDLSTWAEFLSDLSHCQPSVLDDVNPTTSAAN